MHLSPHERTAVFVDGPNMFHATRALGLDVDYSRLLDEVRSRCILTGAHYYTPVRGAAESGGLRSFLGFLDRNGWRVVSKPCSGGADGTPGRIKDIDVDLAVDMVAQARRLDHVMLFSGDGDFIPAVCAAQEAGARVTVVSTETPVEATGPIVSGDLALQADAFVDLAALAEHIRRDVEAGA